jgi:N6-L-threonylcarbamoyladenine synthase
MNVMGIETSCDETSVAVVSDGTVRANVISSQFVHRKYGGVVPELASRAHQKLIVQVADEALRTSSVRREQLQGIAATRGPGLAGALLVGLSFGKALAYALGIPFVGVNHMEGHLYSTFLMDEQPAYPFIALIVSGGHTMLVEVRAPFVHRLLGQTRDDAAGEAFDKVAKMLGLGYPGGPVVDRLAREGDPRAVEFPRAFLGESSYDFSFSGVKTAVLYYLKRKGLFDGANRDIPRPLLADICAGFQAAVVDVLVGKTMRAAEETGIRTICVAGGVSANSELRRAMNHAAGRDGRRVFFPPLEYCMDNGAMIALVGSMLLKSGVSSGLDVSAEANLSL